MIETLLSKIQTTLDEVTRVQESFKYPKTNITKYPAVFYFPAGFENSFETNAENFKTYRFTLMVIVGATQKTVDDAVGVLARTTQDIVAQFDEDWNQGTIDGHRVWVRIDSGEPWRVSEEAQGVEVYSVLSLEIRLLSTN